MNSIFNTVLLADHDRLNGMASHFRKGSVNFSTRDLVILLAVVAAVAGITWILAKILYGKERKIYHRPRKLFRELCHVHGLDAAARRLLSRLARAQGLTQPALMFLSPERFEPAQLNPKLAARREAIKALAEKLFSAGGQAT